MNICACMGPMYGEPLCECKMQSRNLPRSALYLADHTPERIAERNENLRKAFQKIIDERNQENQNEP
jgi:hypothetical protein